MRLLVRRGVYPYEYLDSFEQFEEHHLPPKEAFLSKLHNPNISDADYPHAQAVWNTVNIRTIGEYHDLYLKSIHPTPINTFMSDLNINE